MQIKVAMSNSYKFHIMFSSSYEIAAAFSEAIKQRDDVWNVRCLGLDVHFVTTAAGALRRYAHDFEREWLERKIAEMEAKMAESLPAPSVPLAAVDISKFEQAGSSIEVPDEEESSEEDFEADDLEDSSDEE